MNAPLWMYRYFGFENNLKCYISLDEKYFKCTQNQRNLNWTDEFLCHEKKTKIARLLQNKCFLVGFENTADEEQTKKIARVFCN